MRETRFEKSLRRRDELKKAEAKGEVADDMDYRLSLVNRFHAGEITLDEMKMELSATQRKAKRDGRLTRNDFFKRGA